MDRTCRSDGMSLLRLGYQETGFQFGPAASLFCSEGRQVLCCELPRGEAHMKSLAYSQGGPEAASSHVSELKSRSSLTQASDE